MARFTVLFVLCALASVAFAGSRYAKVYADAVWSDLTGFSSTQQVRVGTRNGDTALYLALTNEWYDTTGTDLPFQYSARGTSIGGGIRQYMMGDRLVLVANLGKVISGPNPGRLDFRTGVAGYDSWEEGRRFTDLYGEVFYVHRAEDVFLNLRFRPGLTLSRGEDTRLWTYLVGQLYASGKGELGTENRVEAGPGIGYIFNNDLTANLELRAGHSFSGTITDRDYFNPTIVLAGTF